MISAVDSQSGAKLIGTNLPFILVLKKGEEVITAILKCLSDANIMSASLSGVGALENPTLAAYSLKEKKYLSHAFTGLFEWTSLNGNIAKTEKGEVVFHAHVTLADAEQRVLGGHLIKGIVGVTAEITVIPLQGQLIRKFDAAIGINLISPE